jgi:Rieske Fe-S protein
MGVEQQGVDLEGNVHTIPVLRMLDKGVEQQGNRPKLSPYIHKEAITPERLLGKPIDASTDIYALGALLYRMLTGRRVFSGKSDDELAQQHLHTPVPSLNVWRKDLPPGLDKIVATAMAKQPTQRFRQPMELANAFHQLVAPQDTARPTLHKQLDITPPPMGRQSVESVGVAQSLSSSPRGARASKRAPQAALSIPTTQTQVSRRRVLSLIVVGGGAAAAVTTVALFGRYFLAGSSPSITTTNTTAGATTPATGGSTHTGTVIARATDVPINSAKTFKLANSSNPGLLIHLSDNHFVAFDSTCTHTGCAVNYNAQDKLLECPCHGAVFDPARNAAVVQGPAPSPLAPVKISVNADGTITTG